MPSLNQDVLFSIGKQLIEDGDSDAVYRFAISGKESLEAIKRVFSNVTTLELHWDHYVIGWGGKCSTFVLNFNKPRSKFLMHLIGNRVRELRVGFYNSVYDPIIDNIMSKKQLNTFATAGPLCDTSFLDKLLPAVSSSLQNVIIQSSKLITPTLRDSLNLKSLTVLGKDGYDFALFCCKTSSLEFSYRPKHEVVDPDWDDFFKSNDIFYTIPESLPMSSNATSIKELTVNVEFLQLSMDGWMKMMEHFPSLESLKFNIDLLRYGYYDIIDFMVDACMSSLVILANYISPSAKIPPKVTYCFCKEEEETGYDLDYCKMVCEEYEYQETNSDFYCFRRTISSVGPRPILFEVQFAKYHH